MLLYYARDTVLFRIDSGSKVPVYHQIADQAHFAINTGVLKPGQRLPSLRALAKQHGLAVNTLVKAMKALEARGVIKAGARSGYRVEGAPAEAASRYAARGVSATKGEVHGAIANLDKGLFPRAFCKITEDYLTGDPERCNVIHADGSGTKSLIAYLHYRERGDARIFHGIAQDSIVMNIDDLLCVGATGRILCSSTINRNQKRIGADVLGALIEGTSAFLERLRSLGVDVHSGGGETADVGDLTPTVVVDSCTATVMLKSDVIGGDEIQKGLAIVGLASFGTASYEEAENSGIGSNGLTSARHDLLHAYYKKKYPETFDAQVDPKLVYTGPYRLEDKLPGSKLTVGQALLSPTRSYAPVIRALLEHHRPLVRGLVHCSGGGQTKCLRFGSGGVHFVKDDLFPPPPIFRTIQRASGTSWREMYQVYNMGHRMEVYCARRDVKKVVDVARSFGIEARRIGYTEKSDGPKNRLTVLAGGRKLEYSEP